MRELKSECTFEVNKITMNYDNWKLEAPEYDDDERYEEEFNEECHRADDYNDELRLEQLKEEENED